METLSLPRDVPSIICLIFTQGGGGVCFEMVLYSHVVIMLCLSATKSEKSTIFFLNSLCYSVSSRLSATIFKEIPTPPNSSHLLRPSYLRSAISPSLIDLETACICQLSGSREKFDWSLD